MQSYHRCHHPITGIVCVCTRVCVCTCPMKANLAWQWRWLVLLLSRWANTPFLCRVETWGGTRTRNQTSPSFYYWYRLKKKLVLDWSQGLDPREKQVAWDGNIVASVHHFLFVYHENRHSWSPEDGSIFTLVILWLSSSATIKLMFMVPSATPWQLLSGIPWNVRETFKFHRG